jgi:hypothetical protein
MMKKKKKLMLLVVAMAVIVGASMNPVSAGVLTLGDVDRVSYNKSDFNISVNAGSGSYSGYWEQLEGDNKSNPTGVYESVTGVFGDGTVLGYRFFNSDGTNINSYADDGSGIVSPATGTDISGNPESWANVWTASDPGVDFANPANFIDDTIAKGSGITGTIDISGLSEGTASVICGGLINDLALTLTMSGAGQEDLQAEYLWSAIDVHTISVVPFDFSDAAGYDTLTYNYTMSTGRRGRFMGAVLTPVPEPMTLSLLAIGGLVLRRRRR